MVESELEEADPEIAHFERISVYALDQSQHIFPCFSGQITQPDQDRREKAAFGAFRDDPEGSQNLEQRAVSIRGMTARVKALALRLQKIVRSFVCSCWEMLLLIREDAVLWKVCRS